MVSFRMFTLVMPFATLLAAVGLQRVFNWITQRGHMSPGITSLSATAAILLLLVLDLVPSFTVDTQQEFNDNERVVAEWLTENCPPRLKIAVYAAGELPYAAPDFQIVDMFGLTDATIAHLSNPNMGQSNWPGHEKFSATAVLRQNPNIFLGPVTERPLKTVDEWRFVPLSQLTTQFLDRKGFWSNHSIQTARLPNGKYLNFIVLNPYTCD